MKADRRLGWLVAGVVGLGVLAWLARGIMMEVPATPTRATPVATSPDSFELTSPAVQDGGELPPEFTGDGAGATLSLAWSNTPAGTKSLALIMHHVAPDKTKWYWILYNIPPETTRLPKNVQGVGIVGTNSTNHKTEYLPPHSKGPGPKTYLYTLYALSAPLDLQVQPDQVGRDTLLAAMEGRILAQAQLRVVYTRFSATTARGDAPPPFVKPEP
jgi:Raf kinase inhibitor-like YbhB/YbcL family protein